MKTAAGKEWTGYELVLTRVFEAPRSLVFKVWVDPQHVAQWWGPEGFTNPVCELEARPGGAIRIDMRGPDGTVYPMTGTYRDIVEPERLSFVSAVPDAQGRPIFEVLITVTLTEQDGKTTQTLKARVTQATPAAAPYLQGMKEGWTQSLVRLERHVTQADATIKTDREMLATRLLDAPRELVWKVWTDPAHLAKWWGPDGFTITTRESAVKPGGVWRLIMHGPDGRDYNNRIVYLEVVKPERLVYKHSPEKGDEPVSFQVTVTFAARGQKTWLTMRGFFPSKTALDYVVKNYGAFEGLKQTLGRLVEHLAKHGKGGA